MLPPSALTAPPKGDSPAPVGEVASRRDAQFESKIGFDRVRSQVGELCSTLAARERIASEGFSTSSAELERRLGLADELRGVLVMDGGFPSGEFTDISRIVDKARVEGTFLEVEEIRTLHDALASVGEVLAFIAARDPKQCSARGSKVFPPSSAT